MTRFVADRDTWRLEDAPLVVGGSPPHLFRLTPGGSARFDELVSGDEVEAGSLGARLVAAGAIHPLADPAPQRFATTTAVIPARDPDPARLASLAATLATVMRVLVVDDGSIVPITVEGAEILRHDNARGPAAARNTGLARCASELVLFVDSDVEVGDAARFAALLAHFDDAAVVAVAPRVRSTPDIGTLAGYEAWHSPLDLGAEPAIVRPGGRVAYVPSTVLAMRRAALVDAGGFDEALRFGEDVDAIWRLAGRGGTCRYEPSVVVHHRPRATWAAWARQRFDYGTSAATLAQRHREAVPAIRVSGWAPLAVAVAALGAPRAAALVAAGSTASLAATLRARSVPATQAVMIAVRLTAGSHVQTARQLGEVVRRTWWPIVAGAAIASRRARRVGAFALAGALAGARRPSDVPIRVVDDLTYGCGVWAGVVRCGEPGPLAIRFGGPFLRWRAVARLGDGEHR